MCGISSEIVWQLFFRFWTRFDPLLAILLVLGGTACVGEPDQKHLATIWNWTEKSPKTKKNQTYPQNVRNFVRNRVATFFSILDPFWPTFGHFTGSGRYSLYRGAGPKRLSKNLKFDRKSPKVKKIELTIKMCGISSGIPWQLFFSILDPFWPTFGHFTSSVQ